MRFLDLFAGIGGFRLGLEQAGHECVGYVEFNEHARKSYEYMHDVKGEWTANDITKVTDEQIRELGKVDIIAGGPPCQPFSASGHKRGFEDTRGTLFFDFARFAKEIKPRYLIIENVKGLLNHNEGRTFHTILQTLDELGYDAEWQCINSKHHGVAQNRERVYIIGHLRTERGKTVFPIPETTHGVLRSVQADTSGKGHKSQQDRFYLSDGIMCTLPHARAKTKCTAADKEGNIFILTAKERMRLQGFPDEYTDRALQVTSEEELSAQAGNSVTINVIREIGKRL